MIVSGGQGRDERTPEAEAMAAYLTGRVGSPPADWRDLLRAGARPGRHAVAERV
jgi:hypothetical protein